MPKGSDLLVRALENEGVDRIFGKRTTPSEVASYLVHALTGDQRSRGRHTERTSA